MNTDVHAPTGAEQFFIGDADDLVSTLASGGEDWDPGGQKDPRPNPREVKRRSKVYTFEKKCHELGIGSMVMIKGHPCEVIERTTVKKKGKSGHKGIRLAGLDIFTGEKCEEQFIASGIVDCPYTQITEYQLLAVVGASGSVSLLTDNGDKKDDLYLPTFIQSGEPTDTDKQVEHDILEWQRKGVEQVISVLSAGGLEKIVGTTVKSELESGGREDVGQYCTRVEQNGHAEFAYEEYMSYEGLDSDIVDEILAGGMSHEVLEEFKDWLAAKKKEASSSGASRAAPSGSR